MHISPSHTRLDLLAEPDTDIEEYEDIVEWLGDEFESELFDLQDVNEGFYHLFADTNFNNKSVFDTVLRELEQSAHKGIMSDIGIMKNNPDVPEELQELLSGLGETMSIVTDMSELLDEAYDGFEQIAKISKDKKITAIAKKMLKRLDD